MPVRNSILDTPPYALVVDDDMLILMDASSILEEAGFQMLEANSVAQALDVLAEHHEAIQLLFTDVQMPGGADGFELARHTAER
jgi:CheY-like chemotaxis protein